jgi:cephalosporin hydroxylase
VTKQIAQTGPADRQWPGRPLRTYFANLRAALDDAPGDQPGIAQLRRRVAETLGDGRRYVSFGERLEAEKQSRTSDVDRYTFLLSQGASAPMTWHGGPMYKSVFDLAMYTQLIQETRPGSIVELGSGSGASAGWLSAMTRAVRPDAVVVSFDQNPPTHPAAEVTYVQGDATALDRQLPPSFFAGLPRPLLIIEDVHVPLSRLLGYLQTVVRADDYVVIEDSSPKQEEMRLHAAQANGGWMVDTRYTDFFGRNATSARNSVFRIMGDGPSGPTDARRHPCDDHPWV